MMSLLAQLEVGSLEGVCSFLPAVTWLLGACCGFGPWKQETLHGRKVLMGMQGQGALGGTGGPELLFSWVPWEAGRVQGP